MVSDPTYSATVPIYLPHISQRVWNVTETGSGGWDAEQCHEKHISAKKKACMRHFGFGI